MPRPFFRSLVWLLSALIVVPALGAEPAERFAVWEKAMAEFEAADKDAPPPKEGILFIGSSSIRLWKLEESFPDLPVINRGFGGSKIADSTHFADRIILPYKPRTIVFYAGDNDIAADLTPEQVHADFVAFVKKVRSELPETRILFIAIKPSSARWKLIDKIREANRLIAAECEKQKGLTFIDVVTPMLGEDGMPRPELYVQDQLHMSPTGYVIWTKLLTPLLKETTAPDSQE